MPYFFFTYQVFETTEFPCSVNKLQIDSLSYSCNYSLLEQSFRPDL